MTVFCEVKYPSEEEDTRACQSPMKTVTQILPLEATTMNNPSSRSGVTAEAIAGATAGVKTGALIDLDRGTESTMIT